ncbi:GTP-binding protein [Thermostilla marina]
MLERTRLILVGGFLGAGKTTLLRRAAGKLMAQGRRVALLANDQAEGLVDTSLLRETGADVDEVGGGCFCCRFPQMMAAVERLMRRSRPEIIIAEPVGSCTDLAATVIRPIRKMFGEQIEVAPFSVLIDVHQMQIMQDLGREFDERVSRLPDSVLHIYRTQLEEADVVVLNKCDLVSSDDLAVLETSLAELLGDRPRFAISAEAGTGVDAWLQAVASGETKARTAQVDYDVYAEGEASMGWLNANGTVTCETDVDWTDFMRGLMQRLQDDIAAAGGTIQHLKCFLTVPRKGHVAGNCVDNGRPPVVRGKLESSVRKTSLLINARVLIGAETLRRVVAEAIDRVRAETAVEIRLNVVRSFHPDRPEPVHRMLDS